VHLVGLYTYMIMCLFDLQEKKKEVTKVGFFSHDT
jgi:hypothetical protein